MPLTSRRGTTRKNAPLPRSLLGVAGGFGHCSVWHRRLTSSRYLTEGDDMSRFANSAPNSSLVTSFKHDLFVSPFAYDEPSYLASFF